MKPAHVEQTSILYNLCAAFGCCYDSDDEFSSIPRTPHSYRKGKRMQQSTSIMGFFGQLSLGRYGRRRQSKNKSRKANQQQINAEPRSPNTPMDGVRRNDTYDRSSFVFADPNFGLGSSASVGHQNSRLRACEMHEVMRLLPGHLQHRQLLPVYSTEIDGFSLRKMRERCETIAAVTDGVVDDGCLLLVGTPGSRGLRLGAYLSCIPRWDGRAVYHGGPATFVFVFDREHSTAEKYRGFVDHAEDERPVGPVGNEYFIRAEEAMFSVGGGEHGAALRLTDHCTVVHSAQQCPTFAPEYSGSLLRQLDESELHPKYTLTEDDKQNRTSQVAFVELWAITTTVNYSAGNANSTTTTRIRKAPCTQRVSEIKQKSKHPR